MKKLLFFIILLFSLPVMAQDISQLTKEEAIELAKQECIDKGVSPEWFGGEERVTYFEDRKMWYISFQPSIKEGELVEHGNHYRVHIMSDGRIVCRRGI